MNNQNPIKDLIILLVDDQKIVAEAIRHILKEHKHIILHYCQEATHALEMAKSVKPTVILQDLMMPGVDALEMIKIFREDPATQQVPIVVLSSREEGDIKSKAFGCGANDYLVKLPDSQELVARIQYHSNAYHYWVERNEAFLRLENELDEAAKYVRSMLPDKISNPLLETDWVYAPCTNLGGDALGYHSIGEDYWAFYLLDVCGHGVGAALLSVSVMNVLRTNSIPGVDFKNPEAVLGGLDKVFKMDEQNGMYFTIWYGVYNLKSRRLVYASSGHPPAILMDQANNNQLLGTENMIIGTEFGLPFESRSITIPIGSQLYLISDGVYEVRDMEGDEVMDRDTFIQLLSSHAEKNTCSMDHILNHIQQLRNSPDLEDDFSILKIKFL